ncbi:Uncharacterised protein [Bordetella pertussis]|nr:Uncharacterised protein [Bordetella pertussis]
MQPANSCARQVRNSSVPCQRGNISNCQAGGSATNWPSTAMQIRNSMA